MARAQTKTDLIESATLNYNKLKKLISDLSEKEFNTAFDFSQDVKKKENHWNRDKNLRDVLAHLYEWHQLLILWITENQKGIERSFLPSPYNWKTYPQMNFEICEKHQTTSYDDAMKLFEESHDKVMKVIETLTNEELFSKGYFDWAPTSPVGSYCVSATASHYDWAMKKIKAHKRMLKNK